MEPVPFGASSEPCFTNGKNRADLRRLLRTALSLIYNKPETQKGKGKHTDLVDSGTVENGQSMWRPHLSCQCFPIGGRNPEFPKIMRFRVSVIVRFA